jgi:hypothetical protein
MNTGSLADPRLQAVLLGLQTFGNDGSFNRTEDVVDSLPVSTEKAIATTNP